MKCSVDGCDNRAEGGIYCHKHKLRFQRHGDIFLRNEQHGMYNIPEYDIWKQMKARCVNRNLSVFKYYGGRGIGVCDRWQKSFLAFIEDMGKRPGDNCQIDRINNDGDYCPGNCRWVTRVKNMWNSRVAKITIEKARKIRKLHKTGNYLQRELALMFSCSLSIIHHVVSEKCWIEIKENK